MTTTSRLRVAISDTAEALKIVKLEVEGATGYPVRPEFQESEFEELVVELRLGATGVAEPNLIARAIERTTPDIDVLGVWNESPHSHEPVPKPSKLVFGVADEALPDVARRAVRDELPTARWHPSLATTSSSDTPHWELAVPVLHTDGESVAVIRRKGYSHRFTPDDAVGTWLGLASSARPTGFACSLRLEPDAER